MGLIARIAEFSRIVVNGINFSEVKSHGEGGALRTAQHASDAGDDSFPLKTDSQIIVGTQESGGGVVVGYFDTKNTQKALEGEKRIYSRDSTGALMGEFWLKADGSIKASNSVGFFELKANGDFEINGAIISAAGVITDASGKILGTHTHPIDGGSSAPGLTGPPS